MVVDPYAWIDILLSLYTHDDFFLHSAAAGVILKHSAVFFIVYEQYVS